MNKRNIIAKKCSVKGCEKNSRAKSFCSKHYERFRKYGNPLLLKTGKPLKEREFHGCSSLKEYGIWSSMIRRCSNEKCDVYKYYGARGIRVCDKWKSSFLNFLEDMGSRPSDKYSIDRIDVNGHYEPSNCRWSDTVTQARNKRISIKNKSGHIGVSWSKKNSKWCAQIKTKEVAVMLGYFKDIDDAIDARVKAEKEYWDNGKIYSPERFLSKNKSGYKGVYWNNIRNKWYAQISKNGKNTHLGFFTSIQDAVNFRNIAKEEYTKTKNNLPKRG